MGGGEHWGRPWSCSELVIDDGDGDPAGDAEAVEQYEVRGLVPASLYEVAVRAFTRAGPGPLSSPRIVDSTGVDGEWYSRRM